MLVFGARCGAIIHIECKLLAGWRAGAVILPFLFERRKKWTEIFIKILHCFFSIYFMDSLAVCCWEAMRFFPSYSSLRLSCWLTLPYAFGCHHSVVCVFQNMRTKNTSFKKVYEILLKNNAGTALHSIGCYCKLGAAKRCGCEWRAID